MCADRHADGGAAGGPEEGTAVPGSGATGGPESGGAVPGSGGAGGPESGAAAPGTGRALTFGVEEEFLLVGAVDGRPVPVAAAVLEHAAEHSADAPADDGAGAGAGGEDGAGGGDGVGACEGSEGYGAHGGGAGFGTEADIRDGHGAEYKHEMLSSQVEAVTGVCTDSAALARQLLRARRALSAGAAHAGALLLACALPPLDSVRIPDAGGARYPRIVEHYGAAMTDFQSNGCHIHVGVPDRETAVAVVNHLRPWLPTLLALSANSPYRAGRDTGYASWRIMEHAPFPGSGVPPYFTSAARWEAEVSRLVEVGALADGRMTFWLARPSARFPTVEFRVCDAAATTAEAVLQATLARALVRTALAALHDGRLALPVDEQVAAAALWSAARYGLRGPAVDPWRAVRVPVAGMVSALLDEVRPALEESGDLEFVSRRTAWLTGRGTGADRQRAAVRAAGRLSAVIGHLADETLRAPEDLSHGPPVATGGAEAAPTGLPPGLPRTPPTATAGRWPSTSAPRPEASGESVPRPDRPDWPDGSGASALRPDGSGHRSAGAAHRSVPTGPPTAASGYRAAGSAGAAGVEDAAGSAGAAGRAGRGSSWAPDANGWPGRLGTGPGDPVETGPSVPERGGSQ